MKKKISIISLVLIFFVSTTGLPLTINLCTMMDTPAADMCEMHSKDNSCEYDAHQNSIKIQIEKAECCKTQLVDKSICDKYLQLNAQKLNPNSSLTAIINLDFSSLNYSLTNSIKYFSDSSPPTIINNHIYLDNSILLI